MFLGGRYLWKPERYCYCLMVGSARNWLINVVVLGIGILCVAIVYAQSPDAEESSINPSDSSSSSSATALPNSSTAESSSDENSIGIKVAPLDPWLGRPYSEAQESSSSSSQSSARRSLLSPPERLPQIRAFDDMSDEELEDLGIGQEEEAAESEADGAPKQVQSVIEKVKLSHRDERRLINAKKALRRRVNAYRRAQREEAKKDPRGKPEIRICQLNANAYGLPAEVKRVEHRIIGSKFKRREKSFVKALIAEKCDVVALQGIVGHSKTFASQGLNRLIEKLSDESKTSWRGYLGDSNHSVAYNGFAVRTELVRFAVIKSYYDVILPRFDQFQDKKFARGPLQLDFEMWPEDGGERKKFVLMTDYLRNNSNLKVREPITYRMQMADALRQLHQHNEQQINPEDPPIIMLLIDRGGPRFAATAEILEGRLHLTDFRSDGNCTVEKDNTTKCNSAVQSPISLFPLVAGNNKVASEAKKSKKKKMDKTKKAAARARTSEIYMPTPDLHYAWEEPNVEGRFKVGEVDVDNGLDNSPMIWVELNW